MTTATHAKRVGFSLDSLAGLTVWYDPSDLTTLFQDAAMTLPVSTDGDPVGCIVDKSGNGHHALQSNSTNKPVFRSDGGSSWIDFSSSSAWLSCAGLDLSHTNQASVVLKVERAASSGVGTIFEFSSETSFSVNPGSFGLLAPHANLSAPFAALLAGTSANGNVKIGDSMAPETAVISMLLDRSQTSSVTAIDLRRNGSISTRSTITETTSYAGNFGNYPLFLGRRNGATLPFTGRLFQFGLCDMKLPINQLEQAETFLG